jgi:hypothetical protein
MPTPNQTGDPITHLNNWYAGYVTSDLGYSNLIGHVDHTINSG